MDYIEEEIYPLTIVADRYTGAYSGFPFTAWNLEPCSLPSQIYDGDLTCLLFWNSFECQKYVIGKGFTVSEALADLYIKLKDKKGFSVN